MKLKLTLIALFSCAILSSQSFLEVQLPKPDQLNPFFIGPLVKSTIHYGVTPPNYNGKVILFNHGYIDLNQSQFLFDNSFYQETYNEGYQAVFVATTRGEGIWINGKLLAESIDIITEKFNVPQIYLVAHSNGGKASEAAMIHYEKKNKVAQAFALGTPFWGTYLADISQMPWLNWAWRLTGLNEGARTSTTYYCRDVVRPYLDNHPNNEPEKFVILGASGFYKGSNLLARAAFTLTGGILLPVQGANDGVAPYNSTLRPGAEYVFRKNDPRAAFDHLDVSFGQFSWPYVQSYIENGSRKNLSKSQKNNNSFKTESNYYIIHSENKYDQILLDKGSEYGIAEIIHEHSKAKFQLYDQNLKKIQLPENYVTRNHQTVIPILTKNSVLNSDSKFVAFIKQNNGIKMSLEQLKNNNHYPKLKVDIYSNKKDIQLPLNTVVRGVIIKTSKIDGIPLQNNPEIITFNRNNDSFLFDTKNLEDGVYSLFLNSENKNNFKRTIISGFVVGDVKKSLSKNDNENTINSDQKSILITPNSVKNVASLSFLGYKIPDQQLAIQVFDITGKVIKKFSINTIQQTRQYNISEQLQTLNSGIYLLKIGSLKTLKFFKE
ncbi:T9SS type A sorting domain-containing protein [Aquimarina sp. 2201CG5-10]|uniref:T9SS type A sorting domain-containing protein n=1 Tax=Aquimarina callyspongiae TaxID=3098150 RepID=UPI002AB3FE7F|nr:T9SS type A sorting domain-containing protein [Aquimarina sp. 2201CG5-10]MDY8136553.1 T9SS type A sorting domain-containing protein [Aquimarina sp. 2201CG5-10]